MNMWGAVADGCCSAVPFCEPYGSGNYCNVELGKFETFYHML